MVALDYATLAEVEAYAGIDFSDGIGPTDDQIASFITDASRLVDSYAGRQLAGTTTHEEFHDSTFKMRHLVLKHRPIVSITSVQEVHSNGNLVDLVEGRNRDGVHDWWLEDEEAGIIRFHHRVGLNTEQFFKVTYVSGATTAPIEAKMATIMLVIRRAARAALNDENCTERIKEMWRPLLADTEKDYREMLERVRRMSYSSVAVFGTAGGL